MIALRATAKQFIPGAKEHIIKKFRWHPLGITKVKYFQIEEGSTPCFPKGRRLVGKPPSSIKDSLGIQANPFLIPPDPSFSVVDRLWDEIQGRLSDELQKSNKPQLVRQGPRRYNYCDN